MVSASLRSVGSPRRITAVLILPFTLGLTPLYGAVPMSIDGNDQVGRKRIETAMDLPEQILGYSEDEWEAWTEEAALSLSDLYRETGYLDAEFRLERLDSSKSAKEGRPAIALHIREGTRYRFGRVAVESKGGGSGLVSP